jgi:hypothetical protein
LPLPGLSGGLPKVVTDRAAVGSGSQFWAVTSYFNPLGYRRRRENFRLFRQELNVPLVAVELSYSGDFELGEDDADIMVRVQGRDVMWQKERLLHAAIAALPDSCRYVACLDCDLVFADADWAERTRDMLDQFALVQPFSQVHWMPAEWRPGGEPTAPSVTLRPTARMIADGMSPAQCLGSPPVHIGCASGFAWAARRELLDRVGLYDACIIGGGDAALVRAAYGHFDDAVRQQFMNEARGEHYRAWAEPFYDAVRSSVGCVDGNLLHLWHGSREDRHYFDRYQRFEPFQFDPVADIAVDDSGVWRWNSDKGAMHDYVRTYFKARREDG